MSIERERASKRARKEESCDKAAPVKQRRQESILHEKAGRKKAARCRSPVHSQVHTQVDLAREERSMEREREGKRARERERERAATELRQSCNSATAIQQAFLGGKAGRQKAAQCRSQVCSQAYTQARGADMQAGKPPIPTGWSSSSAVLQRLATAMLYLRLARGRSLWLFHVKNSCDKQRNLGFFLKTQT